MENTNAKSLLEVAEIYLAYKSNVKPSARPKVNASRDAYQIFLENWDSNRLELCEQFKVLLLNRANKAIGIFEVSSGSVTGTIADPKLVFASALKANACGLIIAHNHPSGNLKPSTPDIDLTKKIREGGKLLEIPLLDHLIITTEGYFSFSDEGIL
jgi:DNA repair protein RadC